MSIPVLYNGYLFDLPWVWSEVLRPQDRFSVTDHPLGQGFSVRCVADDGVVRYRLREALVYELESEAYRTDPQEWPSRYWEEKSDLMDCYA